MNETDRLNYIINSYSKAFFASFRNYGSFHYGTLETTRQIHRIKTIQTEQLHRFHAVFISCRAFFPCGNYQVRVKISC